VSARAEQTCQSLQTKNNCIAKIRGSVSLLLGQTNTVRARLLSSTGTTVTTEEERDIVTRMVLTDGARLRRSFEEQCATVAATVTSVSAAALGVGEESEDENEMVPEEPLGAMRSEGATDLGD
jgi:hypothetical protein